MQMCRDGCRVGAQILLTACRLFIDTWPTLVAILLLGASGRQLFLWAAIASSKLSPYVALFILPLASMSMLLSIILMLHTLTSDTHLSTREPRTRPLTNALASAIRALVPFLAVYASQGMLLSDRKDYVLGVYADEFASNGLFHTNWDRFTTSSDPALLVLALLAFIIRRLLSSRRWRSDHIARALLTGYFEALWLVSLASWAIMRLTTIVYAITQTVFFHSVWDLFLQAAHTFPPLAPTIRALPALLTGVSQSAWTIIIVPFAWFAVGVSARRSSDIRHWDQDETAALVAPLLQRFTTTTRPALHALIHVCEPLLAPVLRILSAVAHVLRVGLIPVTFTCVLLSATRWISVGVTYLIHRWTPSVPSDLWSALRPLVDLAGHVVTIPLTVVLVAAMLLRISASPDSTDAHLNAE